MKMFFEFNKQDYYGLITVEADPNGYCVDEATKIYVETIGGESVDEVLEEGDPRQVTMEYAFWKLANCKDTENYSVDKLLKEFNETENTSVVIDGSLV